MLDLGFFSLALDLEPMSDIVPTAGTSAAVEEEETTPKPESLVETAPEAVGNSLTSATSNSSSNTRNKRRSQDEMVNTPSSKKPRRMSKMRSKRVKI